MDQNKANEIFLEFATKPDFYRLEFLQQELKNSGLKPGTFIRFIFEAFKFYDNYFKSRLQMHKHTHGVEHSNIEIPMFQLNPKFSSDFKLRISYNDFQSYSKTLMQFSEWVDEKMMDYRISILTGETFRHYDFDQTPIPKGLRFETFNWFEVRENVRLTDKQLQQWEKDYRLFLERRPDLKNLLLNKCLEYAEILLGHYKKYHAKDNLLIDSLQSRYEVAKRMVEGNLINKKAKEPKHKTSEKRREALYLFYKDEVLNRVHPLYRYWNDWSKDSNRNKSNNSTKRFNTLNGHLNAVLIKLKAERNKRAIEKVQYDIDKLNGKIN